MIEFNTRVVIHSDPVTEVDRDSLSQSHCALQMVTNVRQPFLPYPEMAARLSATER